MWFSQMRKSERKEDKFFCHEGAKTRRVSSLLSSKAPDPIFDKRYVEIDKVTQI